MLRKWPEMGVARMGLWRCNFLVDRVVFAQKVSFEQMHRRESELRAGARIFMTQKLEKILFANMSMHAHIHTHK